MSDANSAATKPLLVWVPRRLATTQDGLSDVDRFVFFAVAERANNKDGRCRTTTAWVAERVGLASRNAIARSLAALESAGYLTVTRSGRGIDVKVHPTPPRDRLNVPAAAMWPAATGAPRHSSNPRTAFAALVGYLYFADFVTGRAHVRQERVGTLLGISRRHMCRATAALRETLGEDLMVEASTYRADGSRAVNEVTFDWSMLPPYLTRAQYEQQMDDMMAGVTAALEGAADPDAATQPVLTVVQPETDDIDYLCNLVNDRQPGKRTLDESTRARWRRTVQDLQAQGYTLSQLWDLICWSSQDGFWGPRIRTMLDVERHILTMSGRTEFWDWVNRNGQGAWPFRRQITQQTSSTRNGTDWTLDQWKQLRDHYDNDGNQAS